MVVNSTDYKKNIPLESIQQSREVAGALWASSRCIRRAASRRNRILRVADPSLARWVRRHAWGHRSCTQVSDCPWRYVVREPRIDATSWRTHPVGRARTSRAFVRISSSRRHCRPPWLPIDRAHGSVRSRSLGKCSDLRGRPIGPANYPESIRKHRFLLFLIRLRKLS